MLKGLPPKLVMVKTGNIPNKQLIQIFYDNMEIIVQMLSRSNLIEISQTDIAEQS
jgi:predicted nuclease of predicted toxin-antitoxin system